MTVYQSAAFRVFPLWRFDMTDILAVLMWLAGPGLAAVSAFILERLQPFDELSSNGKLIVAVTVAGLIGVIATAIAGALSADSELLAAVQPYANVIVPALSLLAQQLTHGNELSKARVYVEFDDMNAKAVDEDWQP